MRPEFSPSPRPESRAVEWSSAVDGLWVASVDGGYAGSVSLVAGVFITRTDLGVIIDSSDELRAAQTTLVAHLRRPSSPFSR